MAKDDIVAVCGECHSPQPDNYVNNSPFWRDSGTPPPCKYCGGRAIVVREGARDRALAQMDRQRGLSTDRRTADDKEIPVRPDPEVFEPEA